MLERGLNAIVTGARTGIGLAVVREFASKGVNLWVVVHREDADFLDEINKLSSSHDVWIKPAYIDLNDEVAISNGIKSIIQEKQSVDILVNAAGVVSPNRLIQMTQLSDMHKVMNINFFASIQIAQLISRVMCRQKSGCIINIASVAAWNVDLAQLEYVASKAAIIAATKKMAKEWGKYNVRVNAVAPGVTNTKMLSGMDDVLLKQYVQNCSLKSIGEPYDIANMCAFLASDDAKHITGQTIRVDGGL